MGHALFVMKKPITASSELAQSVSRFLMSFEADKVPKDWRTLNDLAPLLRVTNRQVYNIAKRFMKAGHAEQRSFRVNLGTMIRSVPHYKFSKEATKVLKL
jgi:hypothetical protein